MMAEYYTLYYSAINNIKEDFYIMHHYIMLNS